MVPFVNGCRTRIDKSGYGSTERTYLLYCSVEYVSVVFQGKVAIHSPSTGIVDWGRVTRAYGEDFKEMGGHVYTNFKVYTIHTLFNIRESI